MNNSIHIWDSSLPVESSSEQIFLWRSYVEDGTGSISVPRLVEDNYSVLKNQYLSWIYDLGEAQFSAKPIVDHLKLRPNLSFWWMTLLAEKCNYSSSPHITDAIRLLAFNLWALDKKVESVRITTENKKIVACIEQWCRVRKIKFSLEHRPVKKHEHSMLRKIFDLFPNRLKGLIQLFRHIWAVRSLRGVGLEDWQNSDADITFFSYFFNLDVNKKSNGGFKSNLWPKLPEELSKRNCKTNWLHIFYSDISHPTSGDAKRLLKQFNKIAAKEQYHVALESFLNLSVIFETLSDWLRISKLANGLEPTMSNVECSGLNLWPLFKEEWHSSVTGAPSILGILNFNLFEVAIRMLPTQRIGLYLYEQQSWELGLISAWKARSHGTVIGVQHSTMLDWDMRYFHDPRSYQRLDNNDLPMPDKVAVNGPVIMEKSLEAGYPKENLCEVEALRYLYLSDLASEESGSAYKSSDCLTLLVLGDYLESNTKIQMGLLETTLRQFPRKISIIVKPHPAYLIEPLDYPSINFSVTTGPLKDTLDNCDVAYTSPVTSAAVDAYCFGIPVITALDPNSLNLSPLRNYDEVHFVSSPAELSEALFIVDSNRSESDVKQQFFTLDSGLVRWKKLLLS